MCKFLSRRVGLDPGQQTRRQDPGLRRRFTHTHASCPPRVDIHGAWGLHTQLLLSGERREAGAGQWSHTSACGARFALVDRWAATDGRGVARTACNLIIWRTAHSSFGIDTYTYTYTQIAVQRNWRQDTICGQSQVGGLLELAVPGSDPAPWDCRPSPRADLGPPPPTGAARTLT